MDIPTDRKIANVFSSSVGSANEYNVNVDCQWIGRSFEAFFFAGSVPSVDSGSYEEAIPIHDYASSGFAYIPSSWDFSGDNADAFFPGHYIKCRISQKNTSTQAITTTDVLVFIMEMTWNWHGTVDVQISSAFNGEIEYKTTYQQTRSNAKAGNRDVASTIAIEKSINMHIGDRVSEVRNAVNDGTIEGDTIEGLPSGTVSQNLFQYTADNLIGD